jgi:16S rRNA (guanine527-N7)-methyltransferase
VLDIGSGGGFPALVVALTRPDLDITMIEATGKKAQFLQEQVEHFGLQGRARVIHGRAEDHQQPPLSGSFDIVTARAVAPLERLIGWSVPFLRPGGLLYAIKGERWVDELEDAVHELHRYGASVLATPDEVGPDTDGIHPRVVIIQRSAGSRPPGSTDEGKP